MDTNRQHFIQTYHNQTTLDPYALALFLLLAAAMLLVKRRAAIFPVLLVISLLSLKQRVVIAGLDFSFLRLMLLIGALRVVSRGEWKRLRLHELDAAFIVSVVYGYVISVLRDASVDRLVTRLGNIFDALGIYLLMRILIRSWRDVDHLAKYASMTAILIAPFFLIEWQTGRNYFSFFGNIGNFTEPNHGRMRAMGSFSHTLIAGCFWAGLTPLIVARWWNPQASKNLVIAGALSAIAVVISCSSSTPVFGLLVALGATFLIPVRAHLRWFRWGAVGLVAALALVMKAPVWHLFARVGVIGGSTGWHRFNLIDKFIANFDDWWLMGTSFTGHWGHNLVDLTNVFVVQGVRGGLPNLLIYLLMLTLAFRRAGWTIRANQNNRTTFAFAWALGVTLFSHTVMQLAISHFGEILFAYYGTLAMIGSLSVGAVPRKVARASRRAAGGRRRPLGSATADRTPQKPLTTTSGH